MIGKDDGSYRFYLRYYRVEPQGQTPFDIHDYEHIIIVVKGRGAILTLTKGSPSMKRINEGDVVFIGSREPHQIVNIGDEPLEFLCFRGAEILYSEEVNNLINKMFR